MATYFCLLLRSLTLTNFTGHLFRSIYGHITWSATHSDVSTTSIYAYSDRETIVEALESVEHEPANANAKPSKKWKSREAELLAYCGLD